MAYQWKGSLACIATYRVLEGNDRLDEFEEADLPFEAAPGTKLCTLRYYPKTTNTPEIIKVRSYEIAQKFVKLLVTHYTVKRQKPEVSDQKIISELAALFGSGDATILDLAAKVDELIAFTDE